MPAHLYPRDRHAVGDAEACVQKKSNSGRLEEAHAIEGDVEEEAEDMLGQHSSYDFCGMAITI